MGCGLVVVLGMVDTLGVSACHCFERILAFR